MLVNDYQFLTDVIGMPEAHKNAFVSAAQSQRCVILVRATGPTCHGLLEEGYDTKGYRIHGKSCTWGPMAGFVLRDPRLNKAGMEKAAYNRRQHAEAINIDHEGQGWNASTTPLKISEKRKGWLTSKNLINVQMKSPDRWDGLCSHATGISFYYSLIKESDGLWGVYFDNSRLMNRFLQEKGTSKAFYHPKYGSAYEPMLAMTNPPGHRKFASENYKNAVTGDYDLFAIWPYEKDYNANVGGDDHRPLGTVKGSIGATERQNVEHLERNFTKGGQGTKLGNITNRIYYIGQLINSMVSTQVLWHSDESARPFVDDVDLPVIAFTPKGDFFGIKTIMDFKEFIANCRLSSIRVTLSNAWAQNPTEKFANRLGTEYNQYVPADGIRTVVPDWYNR